MDMESYLSQKEDHVTMREQNSEEICRAKLEKVGPELIKLFKIIHMYCTYNPFSSLPYIVKQSSQDFCSGFQHFSQKQNHYFECFHTLNFSQSYAKIISCQPSKTKLYKLILFFVFFKGNAAFWNKLEELCKASRRRKSQ